MIIEMKRILEERWTACPLTDNFSRRRLAEIGTWIMVRFCTGLWGEELPLIELAGTNNSFYTLQGPDGWFKVVINGRTKGNQLSGSKFAFPCANITQGNHLNPGTWIQRLVAIRSNESDKTGRLFHRRLIPTRLSEFENDFFELLEAVQQSSNVIKDSLDVRTAFGILRSSRRGATAHARNMKIDKDIIEAVHRWRREAFSMGVGLRLDLIDVYTAL